MSLRLPPAPVREGHFTEEWRKWLSKIRDILNGVSTLSWSLLNFTDSNLTDIAIRNHKDLQNLQGGTTNEYYHLTSAHHSGLTGSNLTTLHKHWLSGSATLDFPSIAASSIETLTITVTGATVGDTVFIGAPSGIETGLIWSAFVSASDTVTLRLFNTTVGAIDPVSATWKVKVIQ